MKQKKHTLDIDGISQMNETMRIELSDAMDDIANAIQHHEIPECAKGILSRSLTKLVGINFTLTCMREELNS